MLDIVLGIIFVVSAAALITAIVKWRKGEDVKSNKEMALGAVVLCLVSLVGFSWSSGTGQTEANGLTTDDVLSAFQESGVAVPEPRANNQMCEESALKCERLMTTEAVSIYEWSNESGATKAHADEGFGDYQSGEFVLNFNRKHNVDGTIKYEPKPNKQAYKDTLDELVKGSE